MVKRLAVEAAAAAILYSDYALALEWLEYVRGVVWSRYLMLHPLLDRSLDQLRSVYPELATRLQTVAKQLHGTVSSSQGPWTLSSALLTAEQATREYHQLEKEYNDLVSHARTLPGFENFLRPMKASDLVRAARNGPIVVVNCCMDRCDALIILPGQSDIKHLPLPKFTTNGIQLARDRIEHELKGSIGAITIKNGSETPAEDLQHGLAELWNVIVKPVLEYLGYMGGVPTDNLPHITWCLNGVVSTLPLHAAGDYDQPRSRIFDYAISSYTPTITALLSSAWIPLTCESRVLAIGQTGIPNNHSSPSVVAELSNLRAHVQNKASYLEIVDDQAITTAVLDAMEQHDWVHFACHAHQNDGDPTKSAFFLHDGSLDLATISRRSFKNKGLAFLSACQTAASDGQLFGEAVHLSSAMLMAGYSSVIGVMWTMMDEDRAFVSDKLYAQLTGDGEVGNGGAAKALHNAVAELRNKVGEKEFARWVSYVHIGQ
ncbi:hypothetical protein OPQ81_003701 [Rhizoctonia solani]|nr:hypothetical protein OPQ81_003701 [Rhizoctonia solani]